MTSQSQSVLKLLTNVLRHKFLNCFPSLSWHKSLVWPTIWWILSKSSFDIFSFSDESSKYCSARVAADNSSLFEHFRIRRPTTLESKKKISFTRWTSKWPKKAVTEIGHVTRYGYTDFRIAQLYLSFRIGPFWSFWLDFRRYIILVKNFKMVEFKRKNIIGPF